MMKAAVLKLPVLLEETDRNRHRVSVELEAKKLQELIRKLERQNQQLGTRPGAPDPAYLLGLFTEKPPDSFLPLLPGDGISATAEEQEEAAGPTVLDQLELLDLDSVCGPEEAEETWLYKTSKALRDNLLTPLQWCRQVLDHPRSEAESAHSSLSLRLEQVSRWRSDLSGPSPSLAPRLSGVAGVRPLSASCCSMPQSERQAPSHSSLHPVLHDAILSPVGWDLSLEVERTPTFFPHGSHTLRRSAFASLSTSNGDVDALASDSDSSITLGYKLHDLIDVQVMARLQEESLRQSYVSALWLFPRRRSPSLSFSTSRNLEEEDEEDDEDFVLLPPPPHLTRLSHSHTFSSIRDWQREATPPCTPPSTPSTPLRLSAGFTGPPTGPGPQPGPRLGKGPRSGPGVGGLCRAEPQDFRQESGPLQHRVQSPGNFSSLSHPPLKATAYVTPTIKGSVSMTASSEIPQLSKTPSSGFACSSLPHPASFVAGSSSTPHSKGAQPARSVLTPLKNTSSLADCTWSDGCY